LGVTATVKITSLHERVRTWFHRAAARSQVLHIGVPLFVASLEGQLAFPQVRMG
jgi:hypothetical protein